jgi:hypothetical protein
MDDAKQETPGVPGTSPGITPPLAPLLMMTFWMLLGGAAGIKLAQSLWHLLGWSDGEVSIAVPAGRVAGALAGALLGLISNPRLLVLLMAAFAGASAGAVAGKLAREEVGEISGQVGGGLVGGIAWAVWLFVRAGRSPNREPLRMQPPRTGRGDMDTRPA